MFRGNEAEISGFVSTALERLKIEAALRDGVPGIRIENRLQVG